MASLQQSPADTVTVKPQRITLAKKLLFSAIVFAIGCAALLCCLEIGLTIRDHVTAKKIIGQVEHDPRSMPTIASDVPGLNYRLRPNFRTGDIVFNEHGFNMPDREKHKQRDLYRIMVIGDSVTQGTGITATPEAFPNRMDALLAGTSLAGKRIEVWNCGTAGYNAEQVRVLLQHILPPFSPDMVIYYANFNDYWPASSHFAGQVRNGERNQRKESSTAGLLTKLKRFRTVLLARDVYADLCYRMNGYAPVFVDMKIGYPSWKQMKQTILEMREFCKAQDFLFAVGVHPREQFLYKPDETNLAHRDLVGFLDKHAIRVLDPTESMRARKCEGLYLEDGDHCTPLGYDVLAESLVGMLQQEEWREFMQSGEGCPARVKCGHARGARESKSDVMK